MKIDVICDKNNAKCEKMRLSKCIKHFDSKCVKIDAICANFMLTLFVKIFLKFDYGLAMHPPPS